jgi:hypothetical protein
MTNLGLIFIPDISGFSRFVTETEIEHSRAIIQELLETLINANNSGLEISEIEGDAILFYRFGDMPDLQELYRQVECMFIAFHKSLIAYDNRKYCQCDACVSAISLSLKIITHYGEFTGYNVSTFSKLIGKDIIVAHELLKNEIDTHEYWLVTQSLLGDGPAHALADWMEWNAGAKQTQGGTVAYRYTPLRPLRRGVSPDPLPQASLSDKVKVISLSRTYDTDIITLFHASGDFNNRARWQEGVVSVEEVAHWLPRVGMRCRCVLENGEAVTYANSYSYRSDRIEFTETDEERRCVTRFLLEAVDATSTTLTIEHYIPKSLMGQILFRRSKQQKLEAALERSLENLVGVVKEIRLPGAAATA